MPLDNGRIASLLAREGASAHGHLALALKRASRSALLWPDEAADLIAAGRPLTELQGIGPNLSKLIAGWIKSPPSEPPDPESGGGGRGRGGPPPRVAKEGGVNPVTWGVRD